MAQQDSENLSRRERRRAQQQAQQGGASDELIETTGTSEDGQSVAVAEQAGEQSGEVEASEGVEARTENRKARRTAAAQARASRRREQAEAEAVGLDAKEMVDDALIRLADKTGKGLRRYASSFQWVFSVGILGWVGVATYTWFTDKANAEASEALSSGTSAQMGRIGEADLAGKPGPNGLVDPRPIFATIEARNEAALAKYEAAHSLRVGTGSEAFALLGKAGVLLDMAKLEEAAALYEKIATLPLAKASPEILGAALQGSALVAEAKSDNAAALQIVVRLAAVAGFELPALLQQARLQHALGKTPEAKKLLNSLFEKLGPPRAPAFGGLPNPPDFLRNRAEQLVSVVDPLRKEVTVPTVAPGAAAVQQLMRQLEEQGQLQRPGKP